MTPEEKAMTEKAMQVGGGDGPKIPFREDTFHLTEGEKKDKAVGEAIQAAAELTGKVVPEPAVDQAKESVAAEVADISEQSVLKLIDDRLQKLQHVDFLTISFSKTGMIVAVGIVLVLVWLLPVLNWGLMTLSGGNFSLVNLRSDQLFRLATPPPPSCQQSNSLPSIRIRTNSDSLSQISALELTLRQAGFSSIETIYDPSVNNRGVLVATRDGDEALRQKLLAALEGSYQISSEAASLTVDSDFSATLLVGAAATISANQ